MQSGELTVTGKNSTRIPLVRWPREVKVYFKGEPTHVPCHPHHPDELEYEVIGVDEDPKQHHKPGHHHHDRQFFLLIKWNVSGIREIVWYVIT
jgi:hypothetical protein